MKLFSSEQNLFPQLFPIFGKYAVYTRQPTEKQKTKKRNLKKLVITNGVIGFFRFG